MNRRINPPRIFIFDLSRHSHLPSYLQHLIEYWCANALDGELIILFWHTFLSEHADVVELAASAPRGSIKFLSLKPDEWRKKVALEEGDTGVSIPFSTLLKMGQSANYAALYDWELFCQYAQQIQPSHSFIICLDHYLPLLAAGLTAPTPFSGIFMGPSFHYPALDLTRGLQREYLSEKFILARSLRRESLNTLFFLDATVISEVKKFADGSKAVFLPDPVKIVPPFPDKVAELKAKLGIDEERVIFFLFGHKTRRKGVEQLLTALKHLSPAVQQRICILLIGTIDPIYKVRITSLIDELGVEGSAQIITGYEFVAESEVPVYFQLADVILCPYIRHVGMSNIVIQAAAANKPVLSSDYGVMGEMVRRHNLGLVVDTNEPREIAHALQRFVEEDPQTIGDATQMALLADQHEAGNFAAIIYERLGFSGYTAANDLIS